LVIERRTNPGADSIGERAQRVDVAAVRPSNLAFNAMARRRSKTGDVKSLRGGE
jgi:hypothetical protein